MHGGRRRCRALRTRKDVVLYLLTLTKKIGKIEMIVEPHLDEKTKYVIIWVSNAEKDDAAVKEALRCISAENHKNKIKTVIFQSGTQSLSEQIADLLELNAKKLTYSKEPYHKSIKLFIKIWYNICAKEKQQ